MNDKEAKPPRKSRPLNLRDFPDDLYWACKVKAAQRHQTLKQFIVDAVKKQLTA